MNTTPRVPATVQNLIPNTADYSSFTRVFHTISSSGERIAWAVLAKQRGLLLEADTQFQDIDPDSPNQPRIVNQQVMTHETLHQFLPAGDFITEQDRLDRIALRQAGFNKRWT